MQSVYDPKISLVPLRRKHSRGLLLVLKETLGTDLSWRVHNCDKPKELLESVYAYHNKTGFFYTILLDGVISGFVGYRWSKRHNSYVLSTYLSGNSYGKNVNNISKDLLINSFYVAKIPVILKIDADNERFISANRKILKKYENYSNARFYEKESGKKFFIFSLEPAKVRSDYWERKHICFEAMNLGKIDKKVKETFL